MNESSGANQNGSEEQRKLLTAQAARRSLLNFCQAVDPNFRVAWFHEEIAKRLERALDNCANNRKTRLIITIPPRHGKTRLSSQLFPAWALGKYPGLNFILTTYGASLSEDSGMKTRDVIDSDNYQAIFPNVRLRSDVKSKAKWMTGHGGSYTAVGIGGAVTGIGGDVILIDDPHKDRKEAESAASREAVWQYYRSTLYSRLEGYGAIIIIMQRWHDDDLVGRILDFQKENQDVDQFEIVNFPAIATDDEYDISSPSPQKLLRSAGTPLWEEEFSLDKLSNIRSNIGEYNWSSQYQQQPIARELQEFKEETFRKYEYADLLPIASRLKYVTLVDPAISQSKNADNTVVLTVAKDTMGPNIYRIREDAGKYTPSQTVDIVMKHQQEYRSEVWLETVAYQKSLKYALEDEQRKREAYFTISEVKVDNKEMRIRGLVPLYERGVVFHKQDDHLYEAELLQFPNGKHDDRIDCMSFALQALEGQRMRKAVKQFYPHVSRLNRGIPSPYSAPPDSDFGFS